MGKRINVNEVAREVHLGEGVVKGPPNRFIRLAAKVNGTKTFTRNRGAILKSKRKKLKMTHQQGAGNPNSHRTRRQKRI